MKRILFYPVLALFGGAVGLLLRLWQCMAGFEPLTGLPIPGSLPGVLLPPALAALALVIFLVTRPLPSTVSGASFSGGLAVSPASLAATVSGLLLMALSGVLRAAEALSLGILPLEGILCLLPALALFAVVYACKSGSGFYAPLLLIPPVCLVAELVLMYRVNSVDPVLEAYSVQILALAALILAFFRLSSFGFGSGALRPFARWAMLAVTLNLTAAADTLTVLSSGELSAPAELCFSLGGAAAVLGFFMMRLSATE